MPKVALPDQVRQTARTDRVPGIGPGPFARQLISDPGGLAQFGANYKVLPPGGTISFRHWHEAEAKSVYMLAGQGVLVEDSAIVLVAGGVRGVRGVILTLGSGISPGGPI